MTSESTKTGAIYVIPPFNPCFGVDPSSARSLGTPHVGCMVDRKNKEKGKGVETDEDGGEPSLGVCLEGLNLQGEKEDLDFSNEFDELVKDVR
jgi:hypothetical protein